MKKFFRLLLILALGFGCLAGCEKAAEVRQEHGGKTALADIPQPVAVTDLRPGESVEIAVTPELREYYFALGRLYAWFYLPEFDEGEPPTDPLEYWLMIELAGISGWDEYGYYIYAEESPWRMVDENTPEGYGTYGMPILSKAEMDEWVQSHFAGAKVEHGFYDYHKGYDFDGETYYGVVDGSIPLMYFELTDLQAENVANRLVYTATLYDDYPVDEYNFFWPDPELTLEQNRAALAEKMADAETGERAVYEAFAEELISGEMSMDEAIRQMIISGNTQDFPHHTKLQVKYYLNEETGEPFYLAVHWLTADNEAKIADKISWKCC